MGEKSSTQYPDNMRKVFEFALGVFLFLTATAFVAGQPFTEIQGYAYKIGICALFILSLYMQPIRHITNSWVNSIVGLILLTTLVQPYQAKMVAIEGLVHVFLGVILLYIIIQHLENKRVILHSICAVVAINAFMVILQFVHMDPICVNDAGLPNSHMVGLFGFKYVLGAYMALAAPILLFNKKMIFGIIACILTICSMSWAAVGVLAVAVLFGVYFINKKACALAIGILLTLAAILYFGYLKPHEYVTTHLKDSARNYIVDAAGNYAEGKALHPASLPYKIKTRIALEGKFLPILFTRAAVGYGLCSFKYIGPKVDTYPYGNVLDAWNDYLERGIECGIGIVALMLAFFWSSLKRFISSVKNRILLGAGAALSTVPIGIMFHDYFNHFSIVAMMIAIFALFEITMKEMEYADKICR